MYEKIADQFENLRDQISERGGIGQPNERNAGIVTRRLSTAAVRGLRS